MLAKVKMNIYKYSSKERNELLKEFSEKALSLMWNTSTVTDIIEKVNSTKDLNKYLAYIEIYTDLFDENLIDY